ncbi:hypothetical protein Lalb_Chr20g0112131 [Lupinus albus]|uniref:Uncharacterized protein n=1 Tax=Lupinus albus TaxID=3870 RepID=A0A6A4NAP8_LUPAL|nr:hypothetical protein Lalb_Chr20g0112131 [Lupinus albus]
MNPTFCLSYCYVLSCVDMSIIYFPTFHFSVLINFIVDKKWTMIICIKMQVSAIICLSLYF